MDRIAYTHEGFAYLVDDSPVSITPELKRIVIANLKRQDVLDNDIPARLEGIEAEMMKIEMERIEDRGAILNLTQTAVAPREREESIYEDKNNKIYVEEDRGADDNDGMHVITPGALAYQSVASARFLDVSGVDFDDVDAAVA
jgi:hypothetical protein